MELCSHCITRQFCEGRKYCAREEPDEIVVPELEEEEPLKPISPDEPLDDQLINLLKDFLKF